MIDGYYKYDWDIMYCKYCNTYYYTKVRIPIKYNILDYSKLKGK